MVASWVTLMAIWYSLGGFYGARCVCDYEVMSVSSSLLDADCIVLAGQMQTRVTYASALLSVITFPFI